MVSKTRKATEKLNRESVGNYGVFGQGAPVAVAPDSQMYGVMQPAYAANLQKQDDGIRGPLSDIALRHGAADEAARYDAQLQASRDEQIKLQQMQNKYGVIKAILDKEEPGLIGMRSVDDAGNLINDPTLQAASNDLAINDSVSGTRKNNADAIKTLHESGFTTDADTVGGYMTHPLQEVPDSYNVFNKRGYSPTEQTAEDHAIRGDQNDAVTATAATTRANRPGGGDGPTITVVPGQYGMPPAVSVRGKPDQVAPYMGSSTPSGSPLAPPVTGLQSILQKAKAAGMTVAPRGNGVVITAADGRSATYDANGNRVTQ